MDIIEVFAKLGIPLYLVMYAVEVLGPAKHLGLQCYHLKLSIQLLGYFSDKMLPVCTLFCQQTGNIVVSLRLQVSETQVLKLPF